MSADSHNPCPSVDLSSAPAMPVYMNGRCCPKCSSNYIVNATEPHPNCCMDKTVEENASNYFRKYSSFSPSNARRDLAGLVDEDMRMKTSHPHLSRLPSQLYDPDPWSTQNVARVDNKQMSSHLASPRYSDAPSTAPGKYLSRPSTPRPSPKPARIHETKSKSTEILIAGLHKEEATTTGDQLKSGVKRDQFESYRLASHAIAATRQAEADHEMEYQRNQKFLDEVRAFLELQEKTRQASKPQLKQRETKREKAEAEILRVKGVKEAEMVSLSRQAEDRRAMEEEDRQRKEDEEWEIVNGPDLSKSYVDEFVDSDDSATWG